MEAKKNILNLTIKKKTTTTTNIIQTNKTHLVETAFLSSNKWKEATTEKEDKQKKTEKEKFKFFLKKYIEKKDMEKGIE